MGLVHGWIHGAQRRPESADVPQCPRPRVHQGCTDRQIDRDTDAYPPTARFVTTTAKCTETGQCSSAKYIEQQSNT